MAVNRLDMETQAVFSAVQNLYGMTFSSSGRDAVVAVVTMGDSIIALTKHTSEDGGGHSKLCQAQGGEIRGARETTTKKNGEYSLQQACDFCEVIAAPKD